MLPSAGVAHDSNPWHKLSQSQRGLKIVSVAMTQIGTKGANCKIWVQQVLLPAATNKHVLIPNNAGDPTSLWKSDSAGHVINLGKSLDRAAAGDIVQMITRDKYGNPISHTAVIASINSSSITLIESNYSVLDTVTKRNVSRQDFLTKLVNGQFNIYRIS